MSELQNERHAVRETLENLKIASFVYEHDAGARPVSVEETYLGELQNSDLYLGIFWKKYGKYTIDEYNKAKEFGKPCLIYRKESESSSRDPKLQLFLDTIGAVQGEVAPCFFHDGEELPDRIQEDVMQLLTTVFRGEASLPTRSTDDVIEPTKLPCLCDREPQERRFQKGMSQHIATKNTRPTMMILEGHRMEGHRLYVTRLEARSILEYMALAGRKGRRKVVILSDRLTDTSSVGALSEEVAMMLAGKLRVTYTKDHRFVLDYAKSEQIKTLMIVLTITSADYASGISEPLTKLYDVFASYPDIPDAVLIGVLVCVQLDGNEQNFQQDLSACLAVHAQKQEVNLFALPRLTSIAKDDVSRWLEQDEVKLHLPSVGMTEIDALFEAKSTLPMEELFGKLQGLIAKSGRA